MKMGLDILVVLEQSQQKQIDRLNWSILSRHNVSFVYTDRPESWARNTQRDHDILLIAASTRGPSSTSEYFKEVQGAAEPLNQRRSRSISYIVATDTLPDKNSLAKRAEKAGIGSLLCWDPTYCQYFMMNTDGRRIPLPRRLYAKNEVRIHRN